MLVRQIIKMDDYSGITQESLYGFIEELNNYRVILGIKSISVVLFSPKKNPTNKIIHTVLEINTELERLFTFQYGVLKIYAAKTVTLQAVDKIFGPQIEKWSNKPDMRYKSLTSDKRVHKVFWTVQDTISDPEKEMICYKGNNHLDIISLKNLIKIIDNNHIKEFDC